MKLTGAALNVTQEVVIRPFQDADEMDTAAVWHRSGLAAYPYLPTWQALTLEKARWIFHHVIRAECDIWVGTLAGQVVAYLAMKGSQLNRLYVDPAEWRKGWGTRLVVLAKQLSPTGLELRTIKRTMRHALYMKSMASPPFSSG